MHATGVHSKCHAHGNHHRINSGKVQICICNPKPEPVKNKKIKKSQKKTKKNFKASPKKEKSSCLPFSCLSSCLSLVSLSVFSLCLCLRAMLCVMWCLWCVCVRVWCGTLNSLPVCTFQMSPRMRALEHLNPMLSSSLIANFLLTMNMAHVGLSRASEVHRKKPLNLAHSKFESRSRTTRCPIPPIIRFT